MKQKSYYIKYILVLRWFHIKMHASRVSKNFLYRWFCRKGWGLAGGVVSLSDRWSSNPRQDFIESVASVTG